VRVTDAVLRGARQSWRGQLPTCRLRPPGPPLVTSLDEALTLRAELIPKRVDVRLVLNDITVMVVQHISAAVPHIFGGTSSMPKFR
jgi:hypothetical protein